MWLMLVCAGAQMAQKTLSDERRASESGRKRRVLQTRAEKHPGKPLLYVLGL